jgi:hypothetical protein
MAPIDITYFSLCKSTSASVFFVIHEMQIRPKDAHDHIDQVKSLSEPFFVFGNE